MVEVVATDEFSEWFLALDQFDAKAVARFVDLLAEKGVALPFPYGSEINEVMVPKAEHIWEEYREEFRTWVSEPGRDE